MSCRVRFYENVMDLALAAMPDEISDTSDEEGSTHPQNFSNLDWCRFFMETECDCFFKVFGLEPEKLFGTSVSRGRLWMPWVKNRILEDFPREKLHRVMEDRELHFLSCIRDCKV